MKTPHILAISSFAVHGTASLKTFTAILGEKVLPVPSIMLNGLTNMSLVKKFDAPFRELLQSTFELAAYRELELILYIGYLGKAELANIILEMIDRYRQNIKLIITDPVCGDHHRKYVPDEVIAQWPKLIRQSDVVFPNITEIRILAGHDPSTDGEASDDIRQFRSLFPATRVVVTSVQSGDNIIGIRAYGEDYYSYSHPKLAKNYGGSGDAFLALFLLNHFYRQQPFNMALKSAADQTCRFIQNSIDRESTDLVLDNLSVPLISSII